MHAVHMYYTCAYSYCCYSIAYVVCVCVYAQIANNNGQIALVFLCELHTYKSKVRTTCAMVIPVKGIFRNNCGYKDNYYEAIVSCLRITPLVTMDMKVIFTLINDDTLLLHTYIYIKLNL